jgi:hypothetical protein
MAGRFIEGLHTVCVLQLKDKCPFLCSFTRCVFVHARLMSISYICFYIMGFACEYCMFSFIVIFTLIYV